MYKFKTEDGQSYSTIYSPKEIASFDNFDCYNAKGKSVVVSTHTVNFKSFWFDIS